MVDGTTLRDDPAVLLQTNGVADVDVLIGTTREEAAAFLAPVDGLEQIDRDVVITRLRRPFGSRAESAYGVYPRARPAARPFDVLSDVVTDELFRFPSLQFAERRHRRGHPAFVYQFDWPSPAGGGRFGAVHTLELPFTFGNPELWGAAPMLDGADSDFLDRLAEVVHRSWIAFIRTGSPNHDGIPTWDAYDPARRTTMVFDRLVLPVDDAAHGVRSAWPSVCTP